MPSSNEDTIRDHAVVLVQKHFDHINEGDLVSARQQLFLPPGAAEKPVDVYLRTMRELAPFQLVSAVVSDFEDVRVKRHGAVAAVHVTTSVSCSLGNRTSDVIVWWFPDSDQCLISARPTPWVVERLGTSR
jgi:hypothetical protein